MRTPLLRLVVAGVLAVAPGASYAQNGASAQETPIRFEHLTVDDGLSQNSAYGIFQDHHGFMWIGTAGGGLDRYDGYTVKVYRSLPGDTTTLAADNPGRFLETRDGTLWIGTRQGLSRMDPATERFTTYRHDPDDPATISSDRITALAEDRAGRVWVGTERGLNRLDRATGRFERFVNDPTGPPTGRDVISALHFDARGVLWAATTDGLTRFDPATGASTRFLAAPERLPASSLLEPDYTTIPVPGQIDHVFTRLAVCPQEPGVLWLAGRGLTRFDTRTGAHAQFLPDPGEAPGSAADLEANLIWDLVQDPDDPDVLWLASRRRGLLRFDVREQTFRRYLADLEDPQSLGGDRLLSLYADRAGLIWVGTQEAGISRFDPAGGTFTHYRHIPGNPNSLSFPSVRGIAEDRSGALWVATNEGGLTRIGRAAGTAGAEPSFTQLLPDPETPGALRGITYPVLVDRAGALWVGTTGEGNDTGLFRLNADGRTFTHYPHVPGDAATLSSSGVLTLFEDRAGAFWVGTEDGLNRLDRATGRAERFLVGLQPPAFVKALYEDRAGRFWVGTWTRGLGEMDRRTGATTWSLPGYRINSVYERARQPGVLWIATYGNGLLRLDTRSGAVRAFGVEDGLPDLVVYGLLEDGRGHLWMSTNRGIARFDPEAETFYTYGMERGIQSWEFNNTSYYESPRTGELFFGGINGLNAFDPSHLTENTVPPPVVLTGLRLFNRPVVPGPDAPIRVPMVLADTVTLRPGQDVLTFEFAALHYKTPARNRYRYRLGGFNEDWIEAGTERTATYTNLPPGDYIFRVTAANADGVWSEEGTSVRLRVLPPWWRTLWAYLAYGLLVAGAVGAVDRVQRRRIVARERERAREYEHTLRAETAEATAQYLQAENQRQTQELEQARAVQLSMLPKALPEHPCCELAASMQTATEVGGDYYDVDLDDDGTLTLAIGDATGHGLRAGTMVTAAKSLFLLLAREDDLAAILHLASRSLRRMGMPKLFMALALVRLRDDVLELAGAGMPPALIYRAATGAVETVALKGLPLGSALCFPYRTQRVHLAAEDTVVLMSDGFPELFNAGGEMLGYGRAASVLAEVGGASAGEVVVRFEEEVRAWGEGHAPDDDITFVVLRARVAVLAWDSAPASVEGA